MIRDISAHDIVAGNRKTNLRQLVEARAEAAGAAHRRDAPPRDRRARRRPKPPAWRFPSVRYRTTVSEECFLQWATPENRLAGFLRLSLPDPACVEALGEARRPCARSEAMIREVHVYGKVAEPARRRPERPAPRPGEAPGGDRLRPGPGTGLSRGQRHQRRGHARVLPHARLRGRGPVPAEKPFAVARHGVSPPCSRRARHALRSAASPQVRGNADRPSAFA